MEEILQSIKRIIAEEGDGEESVQAADDVLELTEEVEGVEEAAEGDDSMAVDALLDSLAETQEEDSEPSEDVEANPEEVEAMFAETEVAEEPAPEPEPEPEPEVEEEPTPEPEPEPEPEVEETALTPEGLIEDTTAVASAAALKQLISPETPRESDGLGFRSGITVEDLIVDAMRPMLKEWLDKNLPELVEELVQREIRKITAHLK